MAKSGLLDGGTAPEIDGTNNETIQSLGADHGQYQRATLPPAATVIGCHASGCGMSKSAAYRRQPLLNVWADDLSMDELLQQMDGDAGVVFTVNPDHLYHLQRNPDFLRAYRSADIITVDSHYVRLAMGLLGRPVTNRLPGSDIVPAFCERNAVNPHVRIYLLGARPGVAQRARESMNAKAGREMVVGAHGPSMNFVNDPAEIDAVIEMIGSSGANVLFVGLGAPKQELWIASVRDRLPQVRIMMGIGATIDYEAGAVKRAPMILRRLGLEWTYRVSTEPGRYLMRYVKSSKFLWWMLMDRFGRYEDPFAKATSFSSR